MITRLEEALLIAIWRLKENAYGVTINKQVSTSSKKNYSMGALYFALDQLLRKGLVHKTTKHLYREKGGRSRTYYTLTEKGLLSLREIKAYQLSLWQGIPDKAFETKDGS